MGTSAVYEATAAALLMAAELAAPIVVAALVVGVVVAFLQAVFQLNEPTLSFLPKAAAVGFILLAVGPRMGAVLTAFFSYMLHLATR